MSGCTVLTVVVVPYWIVHAVSSCELVVVAVVSGCNVLTVVVVLYWLVRAVSSSSIIVSLSL